MKIRICLAVWLMVQFAFAMVSQEESIFETMEVQRYQVQVNVTDREGQAITGLEKTDFEVRLNGKLQKVETLEYIDLTEIVVDDANQGISQHGRRLFVFFFDFRYTTERGVMAAREAALSFVDSEILSTDLVAVFSASPLRGVQTVTNFTNDINYLREAVGTLGLASAKYVSRGPAGYYNGGLVTEFFGGADPTSAPDGIFAGADRGDQGPVTDGGPPDDRAQGVDPGVFTENALEALRQNLEEARKSERRNYAGEVIKFNQGFQALAKALTYTRGRKNLILFSAGYDSSLLTGMDQRTLMANAERSLRQDISGIDSDQLGNASVLSLSKDLVQALQGSGTVVFAVDTSLVDGGSDGKTGIQALNTVATDTGGRLFQNQNDLIEPLRTVKEITNRYYVLTLVPSGNFKEGSLARLKIDVSVPKARVVAQRGLLLKPSFSELNPLERQLHLADYISKDLLSYEIPLEVKPIMIPESGEWVRLLVSVEVGGDYFLAQGGLQKPRDLEFYAMVIEGEKQITFDNLASQYRLNLGKAENILKQTGVKYFANLLVKPGTFKLKVVARDLNTGKVGSQIQKLEIPADLPRVTGAVLTDAPWVTLFGERETQPTGVDLSYPFKLGSAAFMPGLEPRVARDEKAKFFFLISPAGEVDAGVPSGIKALIQDPKGQVKVIPPSAIQADFRNEKIGNLSPVMLLVDMSQLGLEEGAQLQEGGQYKLMAQIAMEGAAPLRVITEFSM